MKKVFVLCQNDFPDSVYESERAAEAERRKKNRPDDGVYFHVKEVPYIARRKTQKAK